VGKKSTIRYVKKQIIIMDNFIKVIKALSSIMVILVLFGLVLSSNIRSNSFELGETLFNSGPIGILVLIILLWNLRGIPSDILKLVKAKSFKSWFWNDL
tara:strand:+ start:16 stop:312 length:297 start_codon:yes stop_codon:yes gene_type:complete